MHPTPLAKEACLEVWDTERKALDPASSNGSVQGGLSGGTFELRVNGSAYHRSMAVTTWGLRWAASSAWQVLRPGTWRNRSGQAGRSTGAAAASRTCWLVWQASSLGVPVGRQ